MSTGRLGAGDTAIQPTIFDAKGDLLTATAGDTPARIAVGNNGETLVADSSTSTGLRYNPPVGSLANPVINGGFDIWQRGTSVAGANDAANYVTDRWVGYRTGSTYSRQTVSDSTNLPNIQYSCRIQRNSGTTGTSSLILSHSMESVNAIPFAGKAVTLSFYARKGADYSGSGFTVGLYSGTGTDQRSLAGYTGSVTVGSVSATLTTSWQRFVVTGTVPTTCTELAVDCSYTPSGTAGTNDWAEITGVQIDVGTYTASTAPTFRRSGGTLAGELAACQRYYQLIADGMTQSIAVSPAYTSTSVYAIYPLKVTMRTTPTISQTTGTDYFAAVGNSTADYFDSISSLSDSNNQQVRFAVTSQIAVTQGYAYWLTTNNASVRLAVQAEL